jgi:ribosome biogenesis GTPase
MTPQETAETVFNARVVATFGRRFLVRDKHGHLWDAVRRGKRGDVATGDRVRCRYAGPAQAAIEAIAERTSLLFRADQVRVKELAANVDQVALVFAPRPAFNIRFLWRALIAAAAAQVDSLVILNKIDLDDERSTAGAALAELAALGYRTVALSAKHAPEEARAQLAPLLRGRATLLIGQSGMGKSTLLNLLIPDANARTQEYSQHLNVGKQTTTATRWFDDGAGGALIDSPGFQEFGLAHLSVGELAHAFPDFAPYLGQCRFNDCRHAEEPDCAIRGAVAAESVAPARYAFYRELLAERTE